MGIDFSRKKIIAYFLLEIKAEIIQK